MFNKLIFKKKKKSNLNNKKNQGNSFIMVIATVSFLSVLVAAILVAVALCYRLKAYDINARDNFYYLEQAMDEIYAGVGSDAMKHLNTAYDDTVEVVVYFDAASQSYVTMKNSEANDILKKTYIQLIKNDPAYANKEVIEAHINSFLSNPYEDKTYDESTGTITTSGSVNPEGVQVTVTNRSTNDDSLTIQKLILKREAEYSTVNTRKTYDASGNVIASDADTFVQTITTDLVIGKPEFDVNFNTIGSELNDLYAFSIIADKGLEIGSAGASPNVNITGNIYAASDFYNKDYNITDTSDPNYLPHSTDEEKLKYAAVSNYKSSEDRYKNCNGINESSMYSGIYINKGNVIISSDLIIVPGSIAAMNASTLSIAGSNQAAANNATVWADNIVVGGYSLLKTPTSDSKDPDQVVGASLSMRANAYIYDDLELNARSGSVSLIGQYYGYNYASIDNRTFTDACITANGGRSFVSTVASGFTKGKAQTKDTNKAVNHQMVNAEDIEGQAHYNSSAIIVNGENSSLDISKLSDLYIAGQSYIETSKTTTSHSTDPSDPTQQYVVTNYNGENEAVSYDTYEYKEKGKRTVTQADGTTKQVDDNYTTNTANVEGDKDPTNIQDYRTGEAISIKSNQLAYIPTENVHDEADGLYLELPSRLKEIGKKTDASGNVTNPGFFETYWDDLSKIPIIKTVVSGKTYYFFDFSTEATTKAGLTTDVMNKFIEAYADMFTLETGETKSKGETYGFTDITDYDYFKVKMLKVNTSYSTDTVYNPETGKVNKDIEIPDYDATKGGFEKIYSNSAITINTGTTFTIKSKSTGVDPLIQAAKNINANIADQLSRIPAGEDSSNLLTGFADPYDITDSNAAGTSYTITNKLLSQYKEVRWMLSNKNGNNKAIGDAHSMEESDITPINYFFKFNNLDSMNLKSRYKLHGIATSDLPSGYLVWATDKDVEVDADDLGVSDGNIKGMIITKGDVTFKDNVKSFEGIIISGSKIFVNHNMNLSANEEIVKTIVRECDEAQNFTERKQYFDICELLQRYESVYKIDPSSTAVETESTKSISAVQFEDILSFNNWKKNVD